MKKKEIQPGSLYLTYDSFKHILHAKRTSEGIDGFLRYMREDMEYVLREGHNPNIWMSYFQFPDRRDIPLLRHENSVKSNGYASGHFDYFDAITHAAERHNGRCRHTVNMADAIYCMRNEIIPLTPAADRNTLIQRPDYPDAIQGYGTNMPQTNVALPEYRAYMALETSEGVVLFSHTPEGQRQRKTYEKYHELNFFNPSQPGGKLCYWEIIADPFKLQGKVDCLASPSNEDPKNGFKHAFVDREILQQGHSVREYDLSPNLENYNIFCQRTEPNELPRKHLSDMTVRELWTHFTSWRHNDERKLTCIETRAFPGEQKESTFKLKL